MLPVILFASLFVAGTFGMAPYDGYEPEPQKKVVHIPIPKAVIKHKPLRQDKHVEHNEEVPIKKTEVRRVVQKVPLIKEVPLYIYKNKPFYQPRVVPRPITVHEVVGLPIVHDKHVVQPVYIDRPYVVEKKNFVEQPYPVEKPVPIDFIKKITKVYDRKVEVPQIFPVPLVKTIDKPRPVPFTKEVVQYYDVHVNVPRPRPVKVTQHRTHVEKVPFDTPNVIVQKRPVPHHVNEYVPKVPQGFHGRVVAGSPEDQAVTAEANQFGPHSGGRVVSVRQGQALGVVGPNVAPGPVLLSQQFFDGRSGQVIAPGDTGSRGAQPGEPQVAGRGNRREGVPFLISRTAVSEDGRIIRGGRAFIGGGGALGGNFVGGGALDGGFIGGGDAFLGGAGGFIGDGSKKGL